MTDKPGSEEWEKDPADIVADDTLSLRKKKLALESLEQDAHQLLTASNEGMAPEDEQVLRQEPHLEEVEAALRKIGTRPKHKAAQ